MNSIFQFIKLRFFLILGNFKISVGIQYVNSTICKILRGIFLNLILNVMKYFYLHFSNLKTRFVIDQYKLVFLICRI